MPNYRNKNKNRRNKNRNKNNNTQQNNNNQNQNPNQKQSNVQQSHEQIEVQQQQQQQQREQPNDNHNDAAAAGLFVREEEVVEIVSTTTTTNDSNVQCVSPTKNASVAAVIKSPPPPPPAKNDTVSQHETVKTETKPAPPTTTTIQDDMGVKNSKSEEREVFAGASSFASIQSDDENAALQQSRTEAGVSSPTNNINGKQMGKVIVHRIIPATEESSVSVNEVVYRNEALPQNDQFDAIENKTQQQHFSEIAAAAAKAAAKVIIHHITLEEEGVDDRQTEAVLYQVESPKNVIDETSVAKYDERRCNIQELSDGSSSDYNDNPPLVSEAESESETVLRSPTGTSLDEDNTSGAETPTSDILTIQTLPHNAATAASDSTIEDLTAMTVMQEDELNVGAAAAQAGSTTFDEDVKRRRAQKRVALEAHFLPQMLSPRYLHCIMEENSDMSDARSDCSDNQAVRSPKSSTTTATSSDESSDMAKAIRANTIFPKSNLDFSRTHKHGALPKVAMLPGAIREEPAAMVVEAKLVEPMTAEQSCTLLSSVHEPEAEAVEIVYIQSASSSASDLMDLDVEQLQHGADDGEDEFNRCIDLDTDVREIIIKPLLETTTTTPTPKTEEMTTFSSSCSRESTPVNQAQTDLSKVSKFFENNTSNYHMIVEALQQQEQKQQIAIEQIKADPPPQQEIQKLIINEQNTLSSTSSAIPLFSGSKTETTTIIEASLANTFNNETEESERGRSRKPDDYLQSFIEINSSTRKNSKTTSPSPSSLSSSSNSNSLRAEQIAAIESQPFTSPYVLIEEKNISEMNNVREIINANANTFSPPVLSTTTTLSSPLVNSDSPVAITIQTGPPPPQRELSSIHINNNKNNNHTNYRQSNISPPPVPPLPPQITNFDDGENHLPLLTKFLDSSCNNKSSLISTVNTNNNTIITTNFKRQESADSHCSDSTTHSQCTAIHMGASPHSDIDAPPSLSDHEFKQPPIPAASEEENVEDIKKLRLLCTETLASMPYGEDVLEELANVAQNIGEVRATSSTVQKMPYPLPDLPHIDDLQLSLDSRKEHAKQNVSSTEKLRTPSPPPVPQPPNNYSDNVWLGLPTTSDPNVFVCLSPAQQRLHNETTTTTARNNDNIKPDKLLDAHQKFIERRGYHEFSEEQVEAMNKEKLEEQQILKTAAIMRKLRKSLTPPPPPVPPPPVPTKSSETAAKAQQAKPTTTAYANTNEYKNDATYRKNVNEPIAEATATAAPFTDGEENEKHRLLTIINDTNDEHRRTDTPKTSSYENNSRQPITNKQTQGGGASSSVQTETNQRTHIFQHSHEPNVSEKCLESASSRSSINMQSREHMEQMKQNNFLASASEPNSKFPIFDVSSEKQIPNVDNCDFAKVFPMLDGKQQQQQKRFSNMETSTNYPYCSQILSTQPKRYSNIETSSFESKKRIENGQVVYDITNSSQDCRSTGDNGSATTITTVPITHFPIKNIQNPDAASPFINGTTISSSGGRSYETTEKRYEATKSSGRPEIMSALKLNTNNIVGAHNLDEQLRRGEAHTHETATKQHSQREFINKNSYTQSEKNNENISGSNTYDEFRQRAKAAAAAVYAPTSMSTPATAPVMMPTFDTNNSSKSSFLFDHNKIFKDFDDLSKQLNMELETNKVQREKSASLYDLSRVQMNFRDKFDELKKDRHQHMKELEREIERSMRARQSKHNMRPESANTDNSTSERTYEIPIQVERATNNGVERSGVEYKIPIQLESNPRSFKNLEHDENSRFRRAESMFNLGDDNAMLYQQQPSSQQQHQREQQRQRTSSNVCQTSDDWQRYARDLGSSENITKPFAREVEICYQRMRPSAIRAPRMSVSTNDLSAINAQGYDTYNAYNVRRTHAPMLSAAPQKSRPQYSSCYSVLERDPNPTYISTTSRRGVSPAPPPVSPTSLPSPYYQEQQQQKQQYNIRSPEQHQQPQPQQRRSSLPREIHEQQLKYITSKEEELRTEFERLQNERHRLLDEMTRAPTTLQMPQHPMRDAYRPMPKLPTLSEDEVFRQQMAEEWLNKVAEREERRLQKIIKISKINEADGLSHVPSHETARSTNNSQANISDEFLNRVKERRTKLAMPSDSDWESGAESHPLRAGGNGSESDDQPATVKIMDGKQAEASLNQLPRHLREFAKFSDHHQEEIDGGAGHREVHREEERRQEADNNSISSALKKSSIVKTVKISRLPPTPNATTRTIPVVGRHGQGTTASVYGNIENAVSGQVFAAGGEEPSPVETTRFTTTSTLLPPSTLLLPTTTPTNATTTPPINKNFEFLKKIPTPTPSSAPAASLGEMFASSPFKSRIFEEFDKFWQRFEN